MIVLDATVAIKLLTREPGADRALERIADEPFRAAPDWIRVEVANGLARKVRNDGLEESAARAGRAGLDVLVTHETPTLDLIEDAFDLSLRLGHAMYDCLYLALGIRENAIVVTHDKGFAAAARRGGQGQSVELLS